MQQQFNSGLGGNVDKNPELVGAMKTCAKQINLPLSVESKMKLWSILLYLARDWFIKFAPRQQPIGIKAKHNHDWSIVFLPRL